jgi:hypothetical protein
MATQNAFHPAGGDFLSGAQRLPFTFAELD